MTTIPESALFGQLSVPDLVLGSDVADALSTGPIWKHRKVESLRLLEGEFGRRRVSVDLTPPLQALSEYGYQSPAHMLPLTMLQKEPLRDFDVTDDGGQPLPVLGRIDDGFIAWSVLAARYSRDLGGSVPPPLLDSLNQLVYSSGTQAAGIAESLSDGRIEGQQVFDPDSLDRETRLLTLDLASNFLLIALQGGPRDDRRIVKYSSHWHVLPGSGPGVIERFQVGLGFKGVALDLAINGASDVGSYHLEVHAVPGMLIAELELPKDSGDSIYSKDTTLGVVGHAVGSFTTSPDESAKVVLAVARGGVRTVALFTTLFTAITFSLDRLLPNGHTALLESNDGAAALLLIVPAAYSLALARPNENAILSYLLWPLRVLTFFCIALLLFGTASLVGTLHSPYTDWLWWVGAAVSSASFAIQLAAWFVSEPRDIS